MRGLVDRERMLNFMRELGRATHQPARIYFTGGSSAVLLEWRASTIDVDLDVRPESEEVLHAIPALKERLRINVELAAPTHFIPELPAWESRSRFIAREGRLDFYHYDFYSQALAKIERSHARDVLDVRAMRTHGLIDPTQLLDLFSAIEPELYRYPAIDPRSFRRSVEAVARELGTVQ